MAEPTTIHVQVCYAHPDAQTVLELDVAADASLHKAILQSGVIAAHPEIDVSVCKVGVFGKIKPLDSGLHEGDRIEIYRPLIADPMEARRRRAKKQRK